MLLIENVLTFNIWEKDGSFTSKSFSVKKLCFARPCGRDLKATRKFLDEKRAQGYQVHENPDICKKSGYLLTQENVIEVQDPQTSGEVEYVAIMAGDEVFISVGSDHNDRSLEALWTEALGKVYDSAKTKQMVPAVVAKDAWKYEDVKDHWDRLNLRSHITLNGKKIFSKFYFR